MNMEEMRYIQNAGVGASFGTLVQVTWYYQRTDD